MTAPSPRIRLGAYEIVRLLDGTFRVDGGAMFGVVPKTLWQRRAAPDRENRITLALSCYLIKGPGGPILVETGIGPDVDRRYLDFYTYERGEGLFRAIEDEGVQREDVAVVWNSHLHFDHCGGNTIRDAAGRWAPAFPKAKYCVQRGEWEQALHPVERDRPSYIPARLAPFKGSAALELVSGDGPVAAAGITSVLTPGHTAYHQCLRVESGGSAFLYFGDLVPTAAHIDLPYIMSYDLYPVETFANKKKLYEQAVEGGWTVAFSHDLGHAFGTLRRAGRSYRFEPLG